MVFSCFINPVIAQETNSSDNQTNSQTVLNNIENTSTDFQNWYSDGQSNEKTVKKGSTFWLFVRMILVLAFVIACIYGVMWFLKKNNKIEDNDDQFLRQVAKVNVAPGKSVQVVTLLDKKAFVIGVSDNNISLISEIENEKAEALDYKELIDAMNLYSDKKKNTQKPRSFADILDIFMPKGPRDKGVFSDSSTQVNDMLNRQREKFNNEN